MKAHTSVANGQRVYRIDKFKVPAAARLEFLGLVQRIHKFLRTLPGFMEDSILEQFSGPGEFNFVTIAAWESPEAMETAKSIVLARYREIGFNPQEMLVRLGITADLANYTQIYG